MKRGVPVWMIVVGLAVVAGVVAITFAITGDGSEGDAEVDTTSWAEVTAAAEGQTVRLWMWGGEAALNSYIDNEVATAAQEAGVTLERVPIDDTASAIARLATEAEAGTDDGAIDLLWVNGKNFEQGADAGLWLTNWVQQLPNAALLDPDDATLWNDFGVPTLGQEMPWSRAAFVFAYDSASVKEPPRSFDELLTYARANPGRIAYPAPPDFTGSALVRQAVQALGEDAAFELLRELDPLLWRSGETYPVDQAEVEQLFA
ncbi:MAG: ABC transporter substrate-binding protein, partial [Ilumatobacteraceae bacterium]|nr:ABC transporter substrate-binding protein [Ilumatobacteraceae bacterium]